MNRHVFRLLIDMTKIKSLQIVLNGGAGFTVDESFSEIMGLMENNAILQNDFIYFKHSDGCRMAVRKKDIIAIDEYYDD